MRIPFSELLFSYSFILFLYIDSIKSIIYHHFIFVSFFKQFCNQYNDCQFGKRNVCATTSKSNDFLAELELIGDKL